MTVNERFIHDVKIQYSVYGPTAKVTINNEEARTLTGIDIKCRPNKFPEIILQGHDIGTIEFSGSAPVIILIGKTKYYLVRDLPDES